MDSIKISTIAKIASVGTIGILGGVLFSQLRVLDALSHRIFKNNTMLMDEAFGALVAIGLVTGFLTWSRQRRSLSVQEARRNAEAAGHLMARLDILTGLPARPALNEALAAPLVSDGETGVYLLMINLDRFKPLNDLRGHTAGDRILRRVSERLNRMSGQYVQPYHLGGDQFAVLLTEGSGQPAVHDVAKRISDTIKEPYVIEDWRETLTCSIGIAKSDCEVSPVEWVNHADQAMYHAKGQGGDVCVFFDEDLGNTLREKASLAAELRDAVHTNSLLPFFQPILKIDSGELMGFEVLARWNRANKGFVSPEVFIPLAEELGLIDRLSDQLLTRCCEAMQTWDPSLTISFNLSPRQLNHEGLAKRIGRILETAGIPGDRLAIEITETAVFIDMDRARKVISELRDLGVRVSLDDFGIGTSSLAVLSQLPFDTIKIDRSFISDIDSKPQNAKIVRGVLALAQSLELTVTAEGIESLEDLAFLKTNNCVLGQGFFFSRPVPEDALPQLVEDVARSAAVARGQIAELPAPMTTLSPLTAESNEPKGRRAN